VAPRIFEIHVVHSPTNALFINLVKIIKWRRAAALRYAATSPNLYNDVVLPSVLT